MHHLYHDIGVRVRIADRLEFTVCKSIEIDRSIKDLTATATLELPRELRNASDAHGKSVSIEGKSIKDFIRRGDFISIAFGYDGNTETEFEGYITSISAGVPLKLECEDEMFQLKQTERITKHITSGDVQEIIEAVLPDKYRLKMKETYNVGPWLIENATAYEVLDDLRKNVGLSIHFLDVKTLKAGLPIDFETNNDVPFNFSENIRAGLSLVFKSKEDRKLEVTVNSKQSNGQTNTFSYGEKGGDTETITFPGLSQKECEEWAKRQHGKKSFEGFEGTFDSWCMPRTKPGDVAKIVRPFYGDRHQDGKYLIEAVSVLVSGEVGIRRKNEISYKL